jgi:hypothetical protein
MEQAILKCKSIPMMKTKIFAPFLLISLMVIQPIFALKITAVKVGSKIHVSIDGKYFTGYIFSDDEKYPFFYPVNGPLSGASVTSMRNAEYPHHSSLFFGCDNVNGGNYWQEGLERGKITSVNAAILRQGGDSVIFSNECIWSRPDAPSPIKDKRIIIITAPSSSMFQIDIEIILEMLTDVFIHKTNHSLFSARMAADLSVINGGTMINAEGAKSEKETFGAKSPWIDYYGKRGTMVEGLAIFQNPSNPWYPSPWFTRDYGFISPTPMYWPEKGEGIYFKKGEKLSLRYRVLIHAGDYIAAKIPEAFDRYKSE